MKPCPMNPLQRFAAKLLGIPTAYPIQKRSYSGANRTGAAVSGWLAMGTSADAEIWSSLATLRARAWDIHRNDANVHGAIEMIVSQVIDKGLMVQPKVKMSRGKGLNTRVNQEIIDKFERWATNKEWCETSGKHTFYKAQKTILRSLIVSGEVLVRIVRQPFGDSPIPFALEIIEADQLDDRQNARLYNGNEVRMGVEVDQWRRPVAYHILRSHPGDVGFRTQSYQPDRVPASEILHLWNWRGVRPGQTRGISALHAIIIESRNLLGYKESEQVKARIQSCIMGHYQREYPDVEPMETDEQGYRVFTMEPGIIEDLPPGVTFSGFDPSSPNPNFKDFLLQGQRGMAQGMGVASYTVTGDLSDANYSSMRTGMLGERKNFEQLRDDLAEDLISPLYRQFLEIGVLSGYLNLPRDYETRRDFYSVHEVAGSPWAWIDPLKDMQASELALKNGLTTKTRLLKDQGIEFEDICAELAEEKATQEKFKVEVGNPDGTAPVQQTPTDQPVEPMDGMIPVRSLDFIEGVITRVIEAKLMVPEPLALPEAVEVKALAPVPVTPTVAEDEEITININLSGLPGEVTHSVQSDVVKGKGRSFSPAYFAGLTPIPDQVFTRAKNCKKGQQCGDSCISLAKTCKKNLTPAQKPAATKAKTKTAVVGNTVTNKIPKKTPKATAATSPAPSTTTAPTATPAAPVTVTTNDKNLKSVRDSLVKKHGQKLVDDAEQNISKLLNSKDNAIFVAVPNSEVLGFIVGDRFKNPFELASDKYDKGYYDKRKRVEEAVMGVPKSASDGDRPIYGYMGTTKDVTRGGHAETHEGYGSIAVQLKQDVKDRATFTGSDSFKSGVASKISDPNAASLVHHFKEGKQSYLQSDSQDKNFLNQAAKAKSIEDLQLNVHGRQYVETQIRGQVKPSDIEALHFRPKGALDTPSKEVAEWAKANNVPVFINGKKADLDAIINRPEQTPEIKTLRRELNAVLNNKDDAFSGKPAPAYDFSKIRDIAKQIKDDADKVTINPGEADDKVMKHLAQISGYDAKPEVLSSKAFSDRVKADDTPLLIRSVSNAPGKTAKEIQDQLRTGDFHLGSGVYGNGTYVTHTGDDDGIAYKAKRGTDTVAQKALSESRFYGDTSAVMTLGKSANVLLVKDASEHMKQIDSQLQRWRDDEVEKRAASAKVTPPTPAQIAKAKPVADAFVQKVDGVAKNAMSAGLYDKSGNPSGGFSYSVDPFSDAAKLSVTIAPDPKRKGKFLTAKIDIKFDVNPNTGNDDMYFEKADGTRQWYGSPGFVTPTAARYVFKMQNMFTEAAIKEALLQDKKMGSSTELKAYNVAYGNPSSKAKSLAVKQVDSEVREIKKTLMGDSSIGGSSARLAAIMGYDAIAVQNSRKYMNVLNRGALTVRAENLKDGTAALSDLKGIGK